MGNIKFKRDVQFKNLTTFKVGGQAKYLTEVKTGQELVSAVEFAKEKGLAIFVLGGGSDILISEKGWDGLVIKFVGKKIIFRNEKDSVLVKTQAGAVWDKLVKVCVKRKLQGIECMSGIPGTVGAAPIQNIGAYGQELKDTFIRLTAYDLKTLKFVEFNKKNCEFSYRESVFKSPQAKGRYIITDVVLRLKKRHPPTLVYESLKGYLKRKKKLKPTLVEVRRAVLKLRGQRLDDPRVISNAGSFFKNPIVEKKTFEKLKAKYKDMPYHQDGNRVKLFAGWMIEQSGWKGKRYKNAMVSKKNALVITNPEGKASAKEIKKLSEKIAGDVYKMFKVKLEPEVQFIGFSK